MVLREPVFWAVEVLTIVAFEGQLDLEPAHLAFQTLRLPDSLKLLVSSSF
jgi:hypothetical protein